MIAPQEKLNFNGIVEKPREPEAPRLNFDGIVERPEVTTTFNEEVDFSKPYEPLSRALTLPSVGGNVLERAVKSSPDVPLYPDATPEPVTMDLGQKIAHYFHNRARPDLPEPPKGYGREQGKSVTVRVRSPKSSYPPAEQIDDAVLEAMGGTPYVEAGRRYRQQAGEPLGQAKFNLAAEFQRGQAGYDDKAGAYIFNVAPNQRFIHALNTYLQTGSVDAVREVTRQIDEADAKFDKEYAEAREKAQSERGVLDAVGTGLDETAAKAGQTLHNVATLPVAAGARMGLGRNHPELERLTAEDRKAQAVVDTEERAVPAETTFRNKLARGLTETVGDVATKGSLGPAFPVGVFAENLHRGPDEALKRSAPLVPMALAGSAVSRLTGNLSPAARQVLTRGSAAATNVGMSRLQGKTDPADLAVDASLGALMPVGKGEPLERPGRPSGWSELSDVVNLPRAWEASFDDSAILRQNLKLGILHPMRAVQAFGKSFQALRSKERADRILDEIHSDPAMVQKRREAGLYLASDNRAEGTPFLSREETYASRWAQKVPGVKQSERAFTAATDHLRASVFDDYVRANPDASPETLKGIARFVNYASGRGSLTGVRGIDKALTQVFFSPRLAVSNVELLTTPFRGTPEAKAYARRELAKYFAGTAGLLGLARLAGATFSLNPTDPDFAKLKFGNTRIDLGGGYAQLFRYMAQTVTGRGRSIKYGEEYEGSRTDAALRLVRTKLSPQASLVVNVATGKDLAGRPTGLGKELAKLPVPLSGQDVYEAWKDSGAKGAALGSLSLLGAGVQTIVPPTEEEKLAEEVERLKSKPESKGLRDVQLQHNGRVSLVARPYLRQIEEATTDEGQREKLRHDLNRYLYAAKWQPGDRREVKAVERVLSERQQGVGEFMRRRIEQLKGGK
jgi:hypothetical protein